MYYKNNFKMNKKLLFDFKLYNTNLMIRFSNLIQILYSGKYFKRLGI